ncbi:MAG: hypothetical protein WBB23_06815 [Desulforhopalus sp.]
MGNLSYRSAWYSPRGFANEGCYIYGANEDMSKFFEERVSGDDCCAWGVVKHHKTLDNAKARCEREARQDTKRHIANCEIASIGAVNVAEEF